MHFDSRRWTKRLVIKDIQSMGKSLKARKLPSNLDGVLFFSIPNLRPASKIRRINEVGRTYNDVQTSEDDSGYVSHGERIT